ncbi:MAG TPA: putative lipid II flippase FtsW [Gammaproteobacteria bacterium]
MIGAVATFRQEQRSSARRMPQILDHHLLVTMLTLLALGLVMVGSASIGIADRQTGEPFYYLFRQGGFVALGLMLGVVAYHIPLHFWQRMGVPLLLLSLVMLALLLIPGLGRNVNGATRWLNLVVFNLQVSEVSKLAVIIYLAGYLVRHAEAVRSTVGGFLKPMGLIVLAVVLLLLEPDFGASVVIIATAMGMLFLGGVQLWLFGVLLLVALLLLALLAVSAPYRMERLTTFLNPWADPFDSGFQLTQSLIAIGRGEWFGVGLGGSVQKLFYLPEAHTDFVFAVLAEELGLLGAMVVVGLFAYLVWRMFLIGRRAATEGDLFAAYLVFGISLWVALQAFINIGVNMGLLPTKGLTLPLMSYGGSSMMVMCVAMAIVLRADADQRRGASVSGREA